jgi:plastocyanin
MKHLLVIAATLATATFAAAQESGRDHTPVVQVELSSFRFGPSNIRLRADQPVILRLVNTSGGGHNFRAPEFFAAARVSDSDRQLLRKGAVELSGGSTKEILLVPAAGNYRLKCTHTFHSALGMSGRIIVE